MNSKLSLFLVAALLAFGTFALGEEKPHAVIVVGTHHYSPQKTMPPFATELERLGFRTTVINPDWDPEKDKRGLPGLEALAEADVAVFFARFLKLNNEQLAPITKYIESGKPVVGFRTSTHAFNYPKGHPNQPLNHSFGRDAFGTPYRIHLAGKTKIEPVEGVDKHPILTGVDLTKPWESPGTLYLTALHPETKAILAGTGSPKGGKAGVRTNQFGTHELKPVMTDTVAWTWKNKWGGRTFTTSLGHVGDFAVPQSMRVMVNGIFWAAGKDVPNAKTEVKPFTLTNAKKTKSKKVAKVRQEPKKPTLEGSRPNIILVMTDDQGMGDLSCMGNKVVRTPNIDRFYNNSTRFTDFQVSPTCAPTRAAMMSGCAPFKVGVTHTIFQRERMAPDVFTLPQALKSAGYATGLFGKWHLGDEEAYLPQNRGFDEVLMHGAGGIGQVRLGDFPPNGENLYIDNVLLHNDTIVQTEGYCTDVFFHSAIAWIRKQKQTESPYFAYVSLNAPHAPLVAPESYTKRFIKLGYDKGTAGRYGMVENIDHNFGLMLKKLQEWDALDDTLIIFMTDNGATHLSGKLKGKKIRHFNANMKGGKNSPHEGGTHVPAFWQWKGVLDEGMDVYALAAHIDLYKTFTELAGADLPDKMQSVDGRSLLPLLKDPNAEWADRKLFVHCGRWNPGKRDGFKYTKCAVRTERWRLIDNKELYDISKDPYQTQDVSQAHPDVVEHLGDSYDQWWKSVLPLMVNEGLPRLSEAEFPFNIRYQKQLKEAGIPDWAPASID